MQRLCQRAEVPQAVDCISCNTILNARGGENRHQAGGFANAPTGLAAKSRWLRRLLAVSVSVCALALGSCDSAGGGSDAAVPAQPVGNLHDTMTWLLDPAADVLWGSAGFVLTAAGETSLAPTTDDGWARVRHSAVVVAEGGNLLLLPHLLPDPADGLGTEAWVEFAHGMRRIGTEAIAAVDAKDADALFEVGGHLYNVCLACHQVYARGDEGDA